MKATIIGAGIAGLTAALALRHHGVVSTLVEQAPAFGDVGAGIQISSNGMFVLKALGLAPQIEAMGVRARGVELLDANTARKVAYVDLDRYSGGLSHYMLHRADLIAALAVACHENGISFQFGLNVTPQSDIMEDSEALTHSQSLLMFLSARMDLIRLFGIKWPTVLCPSIQAMWRGVLSCQRLFRILTVREFTWAPINTSSHTHLGRVG